MKSRFLYISCCLAFVANQAKTENLPQPSASIHHDPFQKPELKKTIATAAPPSLRHEEAQPWTPTLIMTLRAGNNSMANVDGKLIRLNGFIEGYRLVEVHERSAVFVKHGKLTRLTLDDNNDE